MIANEVIADVQRRQVLDRFRSGEVLASAAMAAGPSYKAANQILRDALPDDDLDDDEDGIDSDVFTARNIGEGD